MKKLALLFLASSVLLARGGGVTGQLWYGTTGGPAIMGHLNSDGSAITTVQTNASIPFSNLAVDPAAGFYWKVDSTSGPLGGPPSEPNELTITEYRIGDNSQVGGPIQIGDPTDEDVVQAIAVDPINHILYVNEWGASASGSGIEKITYNPTTGAMSGGFTNASFLVNNVNFDGLDNVLWMSIDLASQKLYFTDNDNGYDDESQFFPNNGVYEVDLTATNPIPVQLTSTNNVPGGFPPGDVPFGYGASAANDDPNGLIGALAVDVADHLVYFLTSEFSSPANGGSSPAQNALWCVSTTGGANQIAQMVALPAGVSLYYPTNVCGLSFDPAQRQLYVSDEIQTNSGAAHILAGQLSADGKSITSIITNYSTTVLTENAAPDATDTPLGTTFIALPEPNLAASAVFAEGDGALALSPAASITDPTGGCLKGATVSITNGLLSGDTLAATAAGSVTAGYNSATGVLTLTNYDTLAHYQSVLRSVTYNSTNPHPDNFGADPSRALSWTLFDGEPNIPAGSLNSTNTSLALAQPAPAAITSPNYTNFLVGSQGSFSVTTTGAPTPILSESGALPNGVTFTAGTGILAGIPLTGTAGTYPLVFTVTNATGTNTQNFTLTVGLTPTLSCPADILTNAAAGKCLDPAVVFASTAGGYPAPVVSYALNSVPIFSPYVFPFGTNFVAVTATNVFGTNTCGFNVIVAIGPEPQLAIVRKSTNVVVSWPTNYECYTLQFAPLLFSNNWSAYAGPKVTNGANVFVTNNASTNDGFFRLAD